MTIREFVVIGLASLGIAAGSAIIEVISEEANFLMALKKGYLTFLTAFVLVSFVRAMASFYKNKE
ncbi:MAG: hypothetical protein GXP04_00145 [Alphaproteobacteria bacterium]|nr:hypothetical protein [Alphaproteobacteria bacterium]